MKLPSVGELLRKSALALHRFPFVLASAAVGTCAAVWIVDVEPSGTWKWLYRIALAAVLGIPLFFTTTLVAERKGWGRGLTLAVNLAGTALLLGYAASLPQDVFGGPEMHVIRFWLLAAGLHFLVAVAPFAVADEVHGFWHHNRILFLRFLTGALYSAVLYGGLSIALLSLEKLFNFTIVEDRYLQLWLITAGVFNTWFFLAGIPTDLAALQRDESYPKGLKIFSQYVLLPLVTIYLLILYAYEIKILLAWDWPRGWVSNLVLGFSTAGIFALLLLWPVREIAGQAWIRVFSRRYFLALIPLLLMLLLALWRRVGEYGMTESRYVVAVLGLWLAGMVVYFLAARTGNIKVVPASLAVIAFLSAFGPWGAFSFSERSQMGRLHDLLTKSGILVEGSIRQAAQSPAFAEAKEISSILRYLGKVHGTGLLEGWFQRDFDAPGDSIGEATGDRRVQMLTGLMGVRYIEEWQGENNGGSQFSVSREGSLPVGGFEYLIQRLDFADAPPNPRGRFTVRGVAYVVGLHQDSGVVTVRRLKGDSAVATINLVPLLNRLDQNPTWAPSGGQLAAAGMTADGEGGGMRVRLLVESLWRRKTASGYEVKHLYGSLLLTDTTTTPL